MGGLGGPPKGRPYLTLRQSPVFASSLAKQRSARDSASRCADADNAIVNSASAGHFTSRETAGGGGDCEK